MLENKIESREMFAEYDDIVSIEDVMKNTFGNNTDKQNILSEEDQRKAEEIKKHCKGE